MSRAIWSEFLGTALLLVAVVGSGIMAERLSGGSIALALLANSVATGCALYVLVTAFGPVSGAQFNPAVTAVFALRRALSPATAVAYVAAQIAGAVFGVLLAHAMFDLPLLQLSDQPRSGSGLWLAEAVATFGLVLTILAGLRQAPQQVPALVGAYIVAAYWFTASTSFANPAVTLARALTDSFAGILPAHVPAFVLSQLAGAMLAALVVPRLLGPAR